MSEENKLPEGWLWTTLNKVAAINPKLDISTLPDSTLVSFIPMAAVEAGTGSINTSTQRRLDEVKRGFTSFQEGDVLFAKITPCMENGKSAVAHSLLSGIGFGSTEFHVLRSLLGINQQLLYYFVAQETFRQTARAHMTGSAGQLRVPTAFLADAPYPLAPLPEQHRIVSAIEQQFTRLDAGVAALRRAQAKLKRYRAAVLKAAVEGKLTEAWRAEHPTTEPASMLLERILKERRVRWEADLRAKGKDPVRVKYIEPAKPDMEGLPELPEGWYWATVGQAVLRSEYGTSVKCDYGVQGIPVLRIPNIAAGEIDLSDMKYCTKPININEDDSLQIGDLLVCRTNGSISLIGKTALVRVPLEPYHTFASYLLRFRLFETKILPKWLHLFLSSPQGRAFIERNAASSAGQHNISLTLIHGMEFPVPPLAEQEQIVAEVEQRLSVVDQLEWIVEANLKRAERLRQSILQQAFAGRLVPQDPNDEPASVLLERIRKEREGQKKGPTGNGRYIKMSSEPVQIDVEGTRQVELWESVGGEM